MPRPQDIQDLKDHREATAGEHNIALVSQANGVPLSDENGKIDNSWLNEDVVIAVPDPDAEPGAPIKIPVENLPDTVVMLVNGKIPNGQLPDNLTGKTYTSGRDGTASQGSGFYLSDGTDLVTYLKSQAPKLSIGASSLVYRQCGGGGQYQCTQCIITDAAVLSLSSNNVLTLTQTLMRSGYDCPNACGP